MSSDLRNVEHQFFNTLRTLRNTYLRQRFSLKDKCIQFEQDLVWARFQRRIYILKIKDLFDDLAPKLTDWYERTLSELEQEQDEGYYLLVEIYSKRLTQMVELEEFRKQLAKDINYIDFQKEDTWQNKIDKAMQTPIRQVLHMFVQDTGRKKLIAAPYRQDRHSSFSIWEESNRAHDFAYGETFNPVELYMKLSGCDFKTAVNALQN